MYRDQPPEGVVLTKVAHLTLASQKGVKKEEKEKVEVLNRRAEVRNIKVDQPVHNQKINTD